MKASELITLLDKAIKKHGDAEVKIQIYDHSENCEYRVSVDDAAAISQLGIHEEDTNEVRLTVNLC